MRGVLLRGEVIRDLRKKAGLTQEQLAAQVDCDTKTLGKAERSNGRLDLRIAVSIAEALKCSSERIIDPGTLQTKTEAHIEIVHRWNEAICKWCIDDLLRFHTEDSLLEIFGAEGTSAQETYRGIEQLRAHFEETSKILRITAWDRDTIRINAVDDLVFMRSDATIEYIPNGKTYTTRHLNEFEFRNEKIARRTVIADYEALRKIIAGEE